MVDVVLVVVFYEGGLGELTIVWVLIDERFDTFGEVVV